MDKHRCRLILAVCAIGLLQLLQPGLSHASGASDNVFKDDQVRNAVDAVESELEAWYSGGRSIKGDKSGGGTVRGASGNMMELLRNSDKLICSAWIIAFRQNLVRLHTENWTDPPLNLIRAAENLLRRVEMVCDKILQDYPKDSLVKPGSETAETPPSSEDPVEGRPFVERFPGWTVVDEICYRQCEKERVELDETALPNLYKAQLKERQARERLAHAERELAAEQEFLEKSIKKGNRERINRFRRRVELAQEAVAKARTDVERAESERASAEQDVAKAREALERCLQECYRRAAAATGASAGTPQGSAAGTTPGVSAGTTPDSSASSNSSSGASTDGGFTGFVMDPNSGGGE